jgi:short-subunit dehydrogenase
MSSHRPRALVTGASAGIGLSFAEHLARTGHDLILAARRGDRLAEISHRLQSEHGVEAEILVADLEKSAGVTAVAQRIASGDRVDLLVNSAGFSSRGKVAELDPDALERMILVNVVALSRLSHIAMKRMMAEGRGSIINISSGTAFLQFPTNAGYGASKNYVMAFTRHMQVEAAGTDLRIQLLMPGVVDTGFHEVAGGRVSDFPKERVMRADDVVVASLRALEMGEPVCIPSLPDIADWRAYADAERVVGANVSHNHIAPRYH